ncbi:uncharacterized protein [Diadema setosum]|uniref:uncharacterized protein n=1 Tax=Diadema setosum TaxID=31175 RepID=UPI003B3AE42D
MLSIVSEVGTAPSLLGWRGEDISLPCDFQEEPSVVVWLKETVSGQQTTAIFFDGNFESREDRFNMNRNFSLVITDLEVADEGLFLCQVVLTESQVFENSTFIMINSMASKHVIEECVDESLTSQSRCTIQTPSNTRSFNLTCVVSGFKPNISMFWTDESGKRLNSTVSQQTTLSDNSYERFEIVTVSSTHQAEQTFTCTAIGDSLNGTSTTGIFVLPISGKSNNLGIAIGLPFAVLAVVILVLLVGIFLQRHHTYLVQKECCLYPCWRLFKTQRPDMESMMMESLPDGSLTDEQVRQCKNDLKVYYQKTRRKVTVDPLNFMERVNLDEIYTNLSLVDRTDMHKTPIAYEDLLTNDENVNLSKRLLIQGEGGVGKTTLCAKIAWDWCQGRILQDLDLVVVTPLRGVTVDKTIGGIVERYLSDSNEATPAQIDDYISTNLSKVLLVFDGFDEFNGKIEGNSNSEVIRILGLEKYKSCKVIVTSRPWRTEEFRVYKSLAIAYTLISVEGFNKGNVSTYIKRYFRIRDRDPLAETLLNFMDENDVIRSNMAPFPIYCAMLCLMWNDFSEEKRKEMQKLQTFWEILSEMITFLKEHYASKSCENIQTQNVLEDMQEASRAIQAISETALNGLLDRKLSFPEEQFKTCHDAMGTCCKVGVLTIEKDVIDRKRRRDVNILPSFFVSTVSFPHKLFQEYIAGVHIGTLFTDDRPKYNKVKKKLLRQCEEFRYLIYFASASKKELGLDIIDGLIQKGDQFFCLDVAFECHTEEAARAVGKRWEDYKLSPDMSEHTKAGVVFMGICNQAETLLINGVSCGKVVSRYLAEGMCSSSVLRKVTLENPQLHTDFYMIVGKEASNCKIQDLELSFKSLDGDSQEQSSVWEELTKWVFTMPRLSNFSITCPCLEGTFFSTVVASASACQIEDLRLSLGRWDGGPKRQSTIGDDLAHWVFTMPSLSSFGLTCDYLDGDFLATAIASVSSCQIEDLKLSLGRWDDGPKRQSTIGDELAHWVFTMPSLSSFGLTCDYLDGDFLATAIASASSCQPVKIFKNWGNAADARCSTEDPSSRVLSTL